MDGQNRVLYGKQVGNFNETSARWKSIINIEIETKITSHRSKNRANNDITKKNKFQQIQGALEFKKQILFKCMKKVSYTFMLYSQSQQSLLNKQMKTTLVCVLIALCFIHASTQDCPSNYFKDFDGINDYFSNATLCYQCSRFSLGCTYGFNTTSINLWIGFAMDVAGCKFESNVDYGSGYIVNNISCYCQALSAGSFPSTSSSIGYNSATERCEYCTEGCSTCYVDVDVCTSCRAGYEYHPDSFTCARAELGLAAVILAVSALILILGIIGCLKAKKE